MCTERRSKEFGFTIIELLTVMGVIAVLIGLLVPALTGVRDYADTIQQKAQFHSIEVGIDLYVAAPEYETDYPESKDNFTAPATHPDTTPYGGAQKLAEMMVGLDFLGFHPNSDFRANGKFSHLGSTGMVETDVYHPGGDYAGGGNLAFAETAAENVDTRTSFIDLENANAFMMQDVYDTTKVTLSIAVDTADQTSFMINSLVLCDGFKKKRAGGEKTGTPILYFKANTLNKFQDYLQFPDDLVYNYYDNFELLNLGSAEDSTVAHPLADGTDDLLDFGNILINQQASSASGFDVPYRANSYVLMSAGKDGLFGNADDVYNFKSEK